MNPPSLRVWLGGALAAFIDGFFDGLPVGGPVGIAGAAADGQISETLAAADVKHVALHAAIVFAHAAAVSVSFGLADVRAWKKDNPFPNIFLPTPAAAPAPSTEQPHQ